MGAIINQVSNIFHRVFGRLLGQSFGDFTLCRGEHEIRVPINIEAEEVWTKVVSCGCHDGCGQVPVNTIATMVHCGEIIFICKIESNMAKINWFASIQK